MQFEAEMTWRKLVRFLGNEPGRWKVLNELRPRYNGIVQKDTKISSTVFLSGRCRLKKQTAFWKKKKILSEKKEKEKKETRQMSNTDI